MGACHRAKVVFGVWFIILGAADRPGAGGVAADVAGLDRFPQRLTDLPDREQSFPLAVAPLAQRTRALPPRTLLMHLSGAFFFPGP